MALEFSDPRADPGSWAGRLGISREAIALFSSADSIDLHIESYIWTRVMGYDLARRHGHGLLGARFYSQVDFPRALESGMTGGVWSIATNPFRRRERRIAVLLRNIDTMRALIEAHPGRLQIVSSHRGYEQARAAGRYACWLAIQGGNALGSGARDLELIPADLISRITLVHMLRSDLGTANTPLGGGRGGLTPLGKELVQQLNKLRILVDLAHISPESFWDAMEVHDPCWPAIVSHTGVKGVCPLWRNIDDAQIKAIARTGGVVGIVFHSYFLDRSLLGTRCEAIVEHMAHLIRVAGEEVVALGSDWDGLIVTPRDMKTVLEIPVLVQRMLERGWSAGRIGRILGGNYLRVVRQLRP